ncbi:MAG: hypothetical protein AABX79_03100 [Nanoarchaeota archaeon]
MGLREKIRLENKKIVKRVLETLLLVMLGSIAIGSTLIGTYAEPKWYDTEWKRMQQCGQAKNKKPYFLKLNWPFSDGFPCNKTTKGCRGAYIGPFHTILISGDYINSETLVRHEMLHALGVDHGAFMDKIENTEFPDNMTQEAFLEKCGIYNNGANSLVRLKELKKRAMYLKVYPPPESKR